MKRSSSDKSAYPQAKAAEASGHLADTGDLGSNRRALPAVTRILNTLDVRAVELENPAPQSADEAAGGRLGRLQVSEEVGRGGMGRILAARDPELRRTVAVKVLPDDRSIGPKRLARFIAEAQITSQLQHPSIVPVHDIGVDDDGAVWFSMKRIAGRSLGDVLHGMRTDEPATTTAWTRRKLLGAFAQVCNALAYAHERGVVHRDVKPDNIMLGRFGEVLLLDWGVARVLDGRGPDLDELVAPSAATGAEERVQHLNRAPTRAGSVVGTPGYMSPEQVRGDIDAITAAADVWALGALLYEVLTLRRAMSGSTVEAVLEATVSRDVPDPRAVDPSIEPALADLVVAALAPDADDRPANAGVLAAMLEDVLEGTRRREQARRHLAAASEARARYRGFSDDEATAIARVTDLERTTPTWSPLTEKADLLAARAASEDIALQRTAAFAEVVSAAEKALTADPGNPAARRLLCDLWQDRLRDAEAEQSAVDARYDERMARLYDDGGATAFLDGTGHLSLDTAPVSARVTARRVIRRGLVWEQAAPVDLGRTPVAKALPMGSYVLDVAAAGYESMTVPVLVGRAASTDLGTLPLVAEGRLPAGWVIVSGGPFVAGGDALAPNARPRRIERLDGFIARELPVTMAEYAAFLTDLHAVDPEQAWRRCPRQESGRTSAAGQYFARPTDGIYRVPEVDRDGDRWGPKFPAVSIDFSDAKAFCAWQSGELGFAVDLPTERQFEKMVRGVDGRFFPWGNTFDASLCRMRQSVQGRPMFDDVGSPPTDVSVYGIRDAVGGARTWCLSDPDAPDGTRDERPIRGGSWAASAESCRCAARLLQDVWNVHGDLGLRLVAPLPGD